MDNSFPEQPKRPILTCIIPIIFLAVFITEYFFSFDQYPNPLWELGTRSLVVFGGCNHRLVFDGEWQRLFTSTLLHLNAYDLFSNTLVLIIVGMVLEPLIGSAWFFVMFFTGGLISGFIEILRNPNVIIAGSYGSLMGLVIAAYIISLKPSLRDSRKKIQLWLLGALVLNFLMPLADPTPAGYPLGSVLGGAVTGVVLGLLAFVFWSPSGLFLSLKFSKYPLFVLALMVYLVSAIRTIGDFDYLSRQGKMLITEDTNSMPKEELISRSSEWVVAYPHDPSAHAFRAVAYGRENDLPNVEKELKLALDEKEMLKYFFAEDYGTNLRLGLIGILVKQKRLEDAKEIAKPICEEGEERYKQELDKIGLCK